jgi:hydroxymethylglutaryl-CoA lyase
VSGTPTRNVARMSGWSARVDVREVGPRDGLQNEAPVPVDDRVRLIDALSATGLRFIEAAAFVSPTAIPPMAGAPDVMARITRRPGVVYSALVPNPKGAQLATAAGADEIELVVSASETHNQKNVRRSVADSLVGAREVVEIGHAAGVGVEAIVSTAFGCPYEGDVAPERVGQIAGLLIDAGADRLSFGDTTGMATPRRVGDLLDALERAGIGADRIGFHFHDTRGTALANVMAALDRGVTRFDASIGGLGGCPYAPGASGNAVTEDLVHMLSDMDIETGIDLDALLECASLAQEIVGRELPSALLHAGPRTRRYAS